MKSKLLVFLLVTLCFSAYSQEKRFLLNISTGANIDLNSPSGPNSELFCTRPTVAPLIAYRMTYFFSKKIGVYSDIQLNFYKEKDSEYDGLGTIGNIIKDVFDELFWPVSLIHPSIEAGLTYRIGKNKWQLHPEFGFGYAAYLSNVKTTTGTSTDNKRTSVTYEQDASSIYLNFGSSVYYFLTDRLFLVFNANYQQPLKKSHTYLINYKGDVETDRIYNKSIIGNYLDTRLGFGFGF